MSFWTDFWGANSEEADAEARAMGYESDADRAHRIHLADMLDALDDMDHPFHTLWRAGPMSPTYQMRVEAGRDGRTGELPGAAERWY